VGESNDFHTSGRFPKNDEVGKPLEHHPARAKRVFRELPRVICNSVNGVVKLIQEHPGSPHAAPAIPFSGGFGLFQGGRVDSG
jgi:hypothetical protein